MNREKALEYIHGAHRPGKKAGHERFVKLLELLGDPHRKLRYAHIAGTNGKGSTTTMVAQIMQESGCKAGRFVSPYLERFEERISVNGEMISERALCACVEAVQEAAKQLPALGFTLPTEFEVVTAIGFLHFYRQGCDIVALETGIGGLNDITNVIDTPDVAVIASISFDHTKQLGKTLAEIATQKAGIMKHGGRAVAYPDQAPEVWKTLRAYAHENSVDFRVPDLSKIKIQAESISRSAFTYGDLSLTTALPGRHQVYNAVTAVEAARVLAERSFPVSSETIAKGIERTSFPGRLELIAGNPRIILDGAHNEGGIEVLTGSLKRLLPADTDLTIVLGMMDDKDWQSCVPVISAIANNLIVTRPPSPRAFDPGEAATLSLSAHTHIAHEPADALSMARTVTTTGGMIVVCGSIYLIGEVRTILHSPPPL